MPEKDISMVEYVLRLFFPPRCICCDMLLPPGVPKEICNDCEENLPVLKKYEYANPAGNSVNKIISAFDYEGGIREAIHNLKFNDSPGNAAVLVQLAFPILEPYLRRLNHPGCPEPNHIQEKNEWTNPPYDLMIPIPIHLKRKRQRGYNQSEILASHLARLLAVPVQNKVLVKAIHTAPQSTLGRDERIQNLKGAYQVKHADLIQGKRILLVDDIMTTGSTLEQCGKTLKDAGAGRIDAFVMAVRRKLWAS